MGKEIPNCFYGYFRYIFNTVIYLLGARKMGKVKKYQGKTDFDNFSEKKSYKIDRKDLIIMSVMTLIYLTIAIFNLGSTKVPQTYWKAEFKGETFTVNFEKECQISKMAYYDGVGEINFKVEYISKDGKYISLPDLKIDSDKNLSWRTYDLDEATKALRFTVDLPGGTLNEIVMFEKDNKEPLKIRSITNENVSSKGVGKIE